MTTTTYVYDGPQVIAEYEGSTLKRRFIYGPGIDEPVMMVDETTGNRYYYFYDGLGSVAALSKLNGSTVEIAEQYRYDAFGNTRVYDGNGTEKTSTSQFIGNPYMFTGRRLDPETRTGSRTGLYYYRARTYSPELGRFMQTDPIGTYDSMNLYQYCGNNPVNWIDPWGLRHYNYEETQRILEWEHRRARTIGVPKWNPYQNLVPPGLSFGWGYDFKGTGDTFTVKNEKGKEIELKDSEFGNYLAGYLGYYNWGEFGAWGMYQGGNWYARPIEDWWKVGKLGEDDPESVRDITRGVEDAKKQVQKELEEGKRGYMKWWEWWKIGPI